MSEGRGTRGFTMQMTLAAKGLATLLLIVHHGLTPFLGEWSGVRGAVLWNCMSLGKLCVAVFALLSGYGMYLSYTRWQAEGGEALVLRFLASHIVKVYLVFWLTAGLMIAGVSLLKGSFTGAYEDYPVYYVLLDLMALSYPAKSPKFLNSWWYVTAALLYYCLFPAFYPLVRRLRGWSWTLAAALAAFCFCRPGISPVIVYGSCFLAGMTAAECGLFDRFLRLGNGNAARTVKTACCAAALAALCTARQRLLGGTMREYYLDVLPASALVLLVGLWMSGEGGTSTARRGRFLQIVGTYSFEIYLIHGLFLRTADSGIFELFTRTNPVLSLLFLLGASLALSAVVRRIERLLRLDAVAAWCGGRGTGADGVRAAQGSSRAAAVSGRRAAAAVGVLATAAVALMTPELIANLGIGKLAFETSEIRIAEDARRAAVYSETPLLWDFANKTYRSENTQLCSFVDGTYFPHYPGETDVTVSLPFGKSATCHVVVLESAG